MAITCRPTSAIPSSSRCDSSPKWSWSSQVPGRASSPNRCRRTIPRCESRTSPERVRCWGGSRRSHCVKDWSALLSISAGWSALSAWRLGHRWPRGARLEASPDLLSLAKERFAARDYHGATLLLTSLTQEGLAFADAFNLLGLSLAMVDRA